MNVCMRNLREEWLPLIMEWRMRPDITRFMNTDPQLDLAGQTQWFHKISKDDTQRYWMIEVDGTPSGIIQLIDIDTDHRRCSWGYYVAVLKKRSLKLAMYLEWNLYDYVFDVLNMNKLCNETFVENEYVVRLHQLCGSKEDGILREHIKKKGRYFDVSVGSILRKEWMEMRDKIEYEKFVFE